MRHEIKGSGWTSAWVASLVLTIGVAAAARLTSPRVEADFAAIWLGLKIALGVGMLIAILVVSLHSRANP